MSKRQLHVTGMNRLFRCGIAYEKRYLLGLDEPRSPRLLVGSAVDRTAMEDLSSKKATGELMSLEAVQDLARDALVREWQAGEVQLDGEDLEVGWSPHRDDAIDASVSLARLYHTKAAPTINPTHIQRAWVLDIKGLNLQLAGTIDIQEGSQRIRDLKTTGKSPKKDAAETSIQLTTYCLATRTIDGVMPAEVQLDYTVRTPARHDMKLVQLTSRREEHQLGALVERIRAAERIINSGQFTPADPDSWWCSKKWCSFWETCSYALHPVSVVVGGAA